MSSKKQSSAFQSFRVIGKKAQELINKARAQREKRMTEEEDIDLLPPPQQDAVVVKFSITNVVQAALAIVGIIAGVWLLIRLTDILIILLLSFFVAAIIDPGVRKLESWKIPRGVAILIHYFGAIFIFLLLVVSLIPIMGQQLHDLLNIITLKITSFILQPEVHLPLVSEGVNARLTDMAKELLKGSSPNELLLTVQNLSSNLTAIAQTLARFAQSVAGSVLSFFVQSIVVLVLAFFIQIERESIRHWVRGFLPYHIRGYLDDKSDAIHYKIAQWVQGQVMLCISIAALTFVALSILRMDFALTLAALAGFTEFIPYIGPLIGAVPAVIIALTQHGLGWALVVALVFYIIQWCENNLLVPLIMKRAVGLSPVVIIVAMLVGVSFSDYIHPILGILLSVPAATIVTLFVEDWRHHRQSKN